MMVHRMGLRKFVRNLLIGIVVFVILKKIMVAYQMLGMKEFDVPKVNLYPL